MKINLNVGFIWIITIILLILKLVGVVKSWIVVFSPLIFVLLIIFILGILYGIYKAIKK